MLEHGGGTIKRIMIAALLCTFAMVLCVFPSDEGLNIQTPQEQSKISLSGNNGFLEVNAATKFKTVKAKKVTKKTYKKVYAKKKFYAKKTYKKVYAKKTYTYKYVRVYNKRTKRYSYKKVKVVYAATTKAYVAPAVAKPGCTALNIVITAQKITATAKCSCGAMGDYTYHTASFTNYCPYCNREAVFTFNPKGTVEGEWTCSHCGADFCAADGKEKIINKPKYLKPYVEPVTPVTPTPTTNETSTTPV